MARLSGHHVGVVDRASGVSFRVHPTAIVEDGVEIGPGTSVWSHVHIRAPARVGADCIIGEKTYIAYDVAHRRPREDQRLRVHLRCRHHRGRGDDQRRHGVHERSLSPGHRARTCQRLRPSEPDEHTRPTLVREGATIGAGSVIGCDLVVGRWSMVGMGSIVTRSVPDFHLVVGHPPARSAACVAAANRSCASIVARLPKATRVACPACGLRYAVQSGQVIELTPPLAARRRSDIAEGCPGERQPRWGIVGGGMLGLTLAHRFARHGDAVTIFEAAPCLGGLASAWSLDGVVWDRHYHVTLLSDTHLRALLSELGLEQDMKWVETRTGCYSGGQLHSVSNSLEFLRFPPLALIDKLRLGATILYGSKVRNWQRLENVPVEQWLTTWSGRRTFERFWLPLLRAKLGESYRESSAAFIWATIQRLYAARRTGLKKEMFGYVPGGYARILERFAEALGARRCRAPAGCGGGIHRGGWSGRVRVREQDGTTHAFDEVGSDGERLCCGAARRRPRRCRPSRTGGDSLSGHRMRLAAAEASALSRTTSPTSPTKPRSRRWSRCRRSSIAGILVVARSIYLPKYCRSR